MICKNCKDKNGLYCSCDDLQAPDLAGLAAFDQSVIHPAHYQGLVECWDTMGDLAERYESRTLGSYVGHVYKYIYRADNKGSLIKDLRKAREWLSKMIDTIEKKPRAK